MENVINFVTNLNDAKFIVLAAFLLIVLTVQLYLIFKANNLKSTVDIFKEFLKNLDIADIADNDYFSKPVWKVYNNIIKSPHLWSCFNGKTKDSYYITDNITNIGIMINHNKVTFLNDNNSSQININLIPFDHMLIIRLADLIKDGIEKGEVELFKDIKS